MVATCKCLGALRIRLIFLKVDEELLNQQQAIYGGTPSAEPVKKNKKRKQKTQEQKQQAQNNTPQVCNTRTMLWISHICS